MAGVLTIEDQADLDDLFAGVVDDFTSARFLPFLERGMEAVAEWHGVLFAGQHAPSGDPWAPLAPATVKRKGHSTILVDTGRLRGSLRDQTHADGIRETFDEWPGQAGFIFGTEVPYSVFHLEGTARAPARPHVGIEERTLDRLAELAADHALAELMP